MPSNDPSEGKLLLVGNPGVEHIGAHLIHAAKGLNLEVRLNDVNHAFEGPRWISMLDWHFRGRRPFRLAEFGQQVARVCREFRPRWLLATGIAPLGKEVLETVGGLGIRRLNYLTDNPWNPVHRAPWFLKALPCYDHVFSPRRSNLEDLRRLGCLNSSYLPFAYAPEISFPEPPDPTERNRFFSDVVFAGGADRDRLPWMTALIGEGLRVALYGAYWERFRETRGYARGNADPPTLRKAVGGAKVVLCLVRRANGDGNSMRTFEIPAIGTCMLTEDTQEHREIFGEEGKATVYFRTIPEMIEKLRWLLDNPQERLRLARAAHELITQGRHTYQDRLRAMLYAEGTLRG